MKEEYKKNKAYTYLLLSLIMFSLPTIIINIFREPSYSSTRSFDSLLLYIIICAMCFIPILELIIKNFKHIINTIKNKDIWHAFITVLSVLILLLTLYRNTTKTFLKYQSIIDIYHISEPV